MKHSITNRHTKHCNVTATCIVLDWDQAGIVALMFLSKTIYSHKVHEPTMSVLGGNHYDVQTSLAGVGRP